MARFLVTAWADPHRPSKVWYGLKYAGYFIARDGKPLWFTTRKKAAAEAARLNAEHTVSPADPRES